MKWIFRLTLTLIFCFPILLEAQENQDYMNVLFLDGSKAYVVIPFGITQGKMNATVETWVKWESFQKWARVFDFGKEGNAVLIQNEKATSPSVPILMRHPSPKN